MEIIDEIDTGRLDQLTFAPGFIESDLDCILLAIENRINVK